MNRDKARFIFRCKYLSLVKMNYIMFSNLQILGFDMYFISQMEAPVPKITYEDLKDVLRKYLQFPFLRNYFDQSEL